MAEGVTMVEALRQALQEEMERDAQVIILGEDVGLYGGAFKVTEGLFEKFGESRVIDTPISESAIAGLAIGSALTGLRPVAEIQFADFITCGFDQIVNEAATMRYRSGGTVSLPMVVRTPSGGGVHGGLFHSQSPEAWFFRCPGLKVVMPSTPSDAKGLLKAAIRDPDPVIFFEPKYLYRREKEVLPEGDYVVPLGKARLIKEGKDVTIITYGLMAYHCQRALTTFKEKGIEVELIDLRTLVPLDKQAIFESVKKTSRVVIAHEDHKTGGVGAELSALITEELFEYLDAPIVRVAALDTHIPYSPPMEEFYMPGPKKVIEGVEKALSF